MEIGSILSDAEIKVFPTWTWAGKREWVPVYERCTGPASARSVSQTDVLTSPALATEIFVLYFQLKKGVHFRLSCILLSQIFEVEFLVAILWAAGENHEAVGVEIPLTRFDQEKAVFVVIFGSQCVVFVKFPLLVWVICACAGVRGGFCCSKISQTSKVKIWCNLQTFPWTKYIDKVTRSFKRRLRPLLLVNCGSPLPPSPPPATCGSVFSVIPERHLM